MNTAEFPLPEEEPAARPPLKKDPAIKSRLKEFLEVDNYTNFLYIGLVYLIAIPTMVGAVAYFEWVSASELSFWWNVPVYLLAVVIIGASQHQLAGAGHEAVHHSLFKNRKLNELAADWLCMFPIFTSVHQFRLYHLAHHQYVNDPKYDPDFALLKESGHWMNFPVSKAAFIKKILKQVLLVDLVRYLVARVRFNTTGMHDDSPYASGNSSQGKTAVRLGLAQFVLVLISLFVFQKWGPTWALLAVPIGGWAALSILYLTLPDRFFEKSKIKPPIPARITMIGQTAYFTFLLSALGYIQATSGFFYLRYFSLLWYVPAMTAFPLFMILRQLIQHGNGDRGWLTNTRVFKMNPFVRYAIFPFGMDYHLPHHMYATAPHYRLKALHEHLMTHPEYAEQCQVVDNYAVPKGPPPRNPTVVEVLGPEYSGTNEEVFIDDTVLDDWEVEGAGAKS